MVLEYVRVTRLNQLDETLDEPRLAQRRGVQRLLPAAAVAHADHEDAVAVFVEAGCLQVELQPMQISKCQTFEVSTARQRQELLDRMPDQDQPAQIGQCLRVATVALVGRLDQVCFNLVKIGREHQVAVCVVSIAGRALELDDRQPLANFELAVGRAQPFGQHVLRGQVSQ